MNYHRYPNVFLDLGGVVFDASGKSDAVIKWDVVSILNDKYGHRLNMGQDLFPKFLKDYNELTIQSLEGDEFLSSIFDTLSFNQKLVTFLNQRFNIFILSDNYRENITYISSRYHFDDWSKGGFYSYEYGTSKYDGGLFASAMSQVNFEPEEVFLIDDSLTNVEEARKCGILGVLFESNRQVFELIG